MNRQYRRVSTEEQGQGTSLEWQAARLAEVAPNAIDYCDSGFTGTNGNRPDLERLLRDIQTGDQVYVLKLDRLARSLRLLLDIEAKLREKGVPLISATESIDTSTSFGRMVFQILGVVAEWERETIIERTRSGRYARYKEGKWGPGQPLYGYAYNRKSKKLEMLENEAAVVKRIYDSYVFDRVGMEQIARRLNTDHVKPRQQGRLWHKAAVRDILTHSAYKGEHPTGAETPTVIEPWLWELAQERRHANPHLHRREGSQWLLQGMIHCGLCGRILSCSYSHGTKGRRVYSCPGRRLETKATDNHRCQLLILDAELLEHKVYKGLTDAMSNPEAMARTLRDAITSLTVRETELEEAIKPVAEKLAEVTGKLGRLAEDWVVKRLDPGKTDLMRHELEAEEARLASVKQNLDPEQLAEFEDVSFRLELYRGQLRCVARGYTEGLPMLVMDLPETKDEAELHTVASRAWLDRVQAELWAYADRIEIKALIPIKSIESQELAPGCMSGHCPQSPQREAFAGPEIP